MSYDYEKSSVSLYRALFFENYKGDVSSYLKPDKELANAEELEPILHPAYEAKSVTRPPDIKLNDRTGKFHPDSGGTSVFDRPCVLRRADGDFFMPEGTEIPPELKIKKDPYNPRLKATHYTIMPSKPLQKCVLEAKLDQLVRNAIKRQYEAARSE